MKVYGLGEPVETICLKNGTICVIDGKIVRPLVKEKIYETESPDPSKKPYPGYTACGLNTELFIDINPSGRHDIRKLIEK